MKLILEYAPNPDLMHGQGNGSGYWVSPVDPPKQALEVRSLRDAQKKFIAWRERNGLGGGNMTPSTGRVYARGKCIARISYNGRVWTPE